MQNAAHNRLINIDIPIPDLQVEATSGISANPSFVVDIRPLTTKIGKGHQVSNLALLTFGEYELFHDFLLPTSIKFFQVYTKQPMLARTSSG